MQEASQKSRQNRGKFIDTLISQWTKRTGSNIPLNQAEEVACSNTESNKLESMQHILQDQERVIQDLKRKLKESQQVEAFLSATLEKEAHNKEEIQTKLNATWESVNTITEYFNYISESLTSFQQHRANLFTLYNNVILKQQETIQQLQLNETKSKDLENHVAQVENKSLLQEKRLQEAIAEQEKLRKQLENSEHKLQLQKNELTNCNSEKLVLVKEQQRLLSKYESSQSRLQMLEEEKCNIAKLLAQLENKLHLEEEKMQAALTEQNKLQKQLENSEHELQLQKNELANSNAEKLKLAQEQQRLQTESANLQWQLQAIKEEKCNTAKSTEQLEIKLRLEEEKMQAALTEQNKLRKQLENSEYELQLQKNELTNSRTEKLKLVKEQQQLLSQCESLQSRLQAVEKEKSDIAKLVTELESKLQLQEEEIQEALTEQNKLQNQIDDTKREFYSQKNELKSAHTEEKEILIKEKQQLLSKLDSLQSQLKILQKDKSNITEIIAHRDAHLSKLENEVSMYKNQIDAMETNNNEARTKCEALVEKQNLCEKELRAKTEKIQNLEATLSEMQKNLERTKISNDLTNLVHQQQLKTLQEEKKEALKRESTRIQENQQLLSKLENLQSQLILQIDSHQNSEYNESLQEKMKEMSQKSNENREPNFTKAQKNVKRKNEVRFSPEIIENSDESHQVDGPAERKFFKSGPILRTYSRRTQN
ncbi:myosin heavy chain, clone 203-like [Linepithema humile]|uniref:myosin heavy chain, clone 203-like n=1 Tax=Linepithema humile TaxID=83485 RepID=UPI0006238C7A|nr:PREDICTED: myosin-11-like [Linepithema humile]